MSAAQQPPGRGAAGIAATFRQVPGPARTLIFGMLVNRLGAFLAYFLVIYLLHKGHAAVQAGFALSAYGVGGIVGGLLGGWLTDHVGCRGTIVSSSVAAGVLTIAAYYAPTFPLFVALVAVVGALGYAYRPASSALLAELVPAERYTMVFAMYRLAMNLGTAGAPLIGAALILIGFGALFWVEGAVLLAFAVIARTALPTDTRRARSGSGEAEGGTRLEMLRDGRFLIFLVSALVVSVVYFQYLSVLPLQVVRSGDATDVYATLVTINAVIVACLELLVTKLVQHWPPRATLVLNYVLIGAGMSLYALPWGVPGLVTATVIWSFGEIVGAPTFFTYPAQVAPPRLRGRYLGASGAVTGLAFSLGPIAGPPLWSALGRGFWPVSGLVCLVAALAVYVGVLPVSRLRGDALGSASNTTSDAVLVRERGKVNASDSRTLLLVAPPANPELYWTPRELGLSIVLVSKTHPGPGLVDAHLPADELDEEDVARAVASFTAYGRRIDAVACFSEGSLRAAARAAADLGLPGNSPQTVMNMRDKAQTAKVLAAHGVPAPRTVVAATADEGVRAARRFGYPVVLKPQSSGASQGVTKARDEAAVRRAFAMISSLHEQQEFTCGPFSVRNVATVYMDPVRRGVLVQEFVDGPEYALDFVYSDGDFGLLGIHDKPSEWAEDYFIERTYVTPPDLTDSQHRELVNVAVLGLRAVGATTGSAHVEVRRTAQGPKIIEINGRLGGTAAYVQESFLASTGVWGPREYLRAVLGERPRTAEARRFAGFTALLADRTGCIEGFKGAEQTLAIPGVEAIRWMSKPGDHVVIQYPANPVSCFALVLATGDTREEVLQALALAERTLVPQINGSVAAPGAGR